MLYRILPLAIDVWMWIYENVQTYGASAHLGYTIHHNYNSGSLLKMHIRYRAHKSPDAHILYNYAISLHQN